MGRLKSPNKKILAVAVLLIGLLVSGYLLSRSGPVTVAEQTKKDISEGKCSDATLANLKAVANNAKSDDKPAEEAPALADLANCYVYKKQDSEALGYFKEAKAAYELAKLTDKASLMQNSITALEAAAQSAGVLSEEDKKREVISTGE